MFLTLGRQRYGQTRSIFAQALNDTAYTNNPKFLTVVNEYGFHAIPDSSKQSIADRAEIYLRMASDIWNPDVIKEIAGGWADDDEKDFFLLPYRWMRLCRYWRMHINRCADKELQSDGRLEQHPKT